MQKITSHRGAVRAALLLFLVTALLLPALAAAAAQPDVPAEMADPAMPPLEGGATSEAPAQLLPQPVPVAPAQGDAPFINVWYGGNQRFGHRGNPQKWVNIPGNVSSALPLTAFGYRLNNGPSRPLTVGRDGFRLVQAGDFNVELDYTDLRPGFNQVVITAVDSQGGVSTAVVNVDYQGGGTTWTPRTYTYDWSTASRIDDLGQVVDGQWILQGGGVRPTVFKFDRLLAIGDLSWRDYTVTVPVTVFGIDPEGYGGSSNGPGVGLLVRWAGHYDAGDDRTPLTGWRRLGALAWYRWQRKNNIFTEGFQLLGHTGRLLGESPQKLNFNTTYLFKVQIQSGSDFAAPATYRFKVWPAGQNEPAAWMIDKRGVTGEPTGGSFLLLAHHVDARFGTVRVDLASTRPRPSLSVQTAGSGQGLVYRTPPGPTYRFGEDVIVSASPGLSSHFAGWSGALSGNVNPGVLSMFESQSVTATFQPGGFGAVMPLVTR